MCNVGITAPPELKCDVGQKIHALGRVERRVMWNFLAHMAAAGWTPCAVLYDEWVDVSTVNEVMEEVFSMDEIQVVFRKDKNEHCVYIVLGNDGDDIISDWSYFTSDHDGFNAAVESFDAARVADSIR